MKFQWLIDFFESNNPLPDWVESWSLGIQASIAFGEPVKIGPKGISNLADFWGKKAGRKGSNAYKKAVGEFMEKMNSSLIA